MSDELTDRMTRALEESYRDGLRQMAYQITLRIMQKKGDYKEAYDILKTAGLETHEEIDARVKEIMDGLYETK